LLSSKKVRKTRKGRGLQNKWGGCKRKGELENNRSFENHEQTNNKGKGKEKMISQRRGTIGEPKYPWGGDKTLRGGKTSHFVWTRELGVCPLKDIEQVSRKGGGNTLDFQIPEGGRVEEREVAEKIPIRNFAQTISKRQAGAMVHQATEARTGRGEKQGNLCCTPASS